MAQQSLSDSLQRRLETPLADTLRVQILDQLSRSLMYSKPLTAMQYAQEGLKLAGRTGDQRGEARILNRIGTIFRLTANYDRSLEAHLQSVEVATANEDSDALARTYNNLGNLYSEQKNSPKAIEYYRQTAHLASQLGNLSLQRIVRSNIGSEYAILNRLDSALIYAQTAYQDALRLKAPDRQIELMILANIHKRMNRHPQALLYYRQSIPMSVAVKNDRTLSQTYLEMAEVFRAVQQTDSAVGYAEKSLKLAQSAAMPTTVQKAGVLLSELYEGADPRRSLGYLKLASTTKDSLVNEEKVKSFQNIEFSEKMRLDDAVRLEENYRTRITLYLLAAGLGALLLIAAILYRNNRQKQKANRLLQTQRDEIAAQRQKAEQALTELKATQAQLIQKEKLASLGELTAGIAHEIQNPLNFVNNFSEVSVELMAEQKEALINGETEEAVLIANDLTENLRRIHQNGQRASNIVRGMLEHSRASTGERQLTNLNALCEEYLRLACHGLRGSEGRPPGDPANDKSAPADQFNVTMETDFDPSLEPVNLVGQDIGRVLLNLLNNAFYAIQQRAKKGEAGYVPTVWVSTAQTGYGVEIRVRDNGAGMSETVRAKVFQPFFTTKPTGEGTGLGLSLSYDIITKGHGGTLEVTSVESESHEGEAHESVGTEFVIGLNR